MERPFAKILFVLGLILFVIVVALVAVHYKFPYRQAAKVAVTRAEAATPIRLGFDGPYPGYPLFYHLKRVTVDLAMPSENFPLFYFDRVRFKLEPLRIAARRIKVDFLAWSGKGKVNGWVEYLPTGNRDFKLQINNIDLPDFIMADPKGRGTLQGHLRGHMTVLSTNGVLPTGGEGELEIGPGNLSDIKYPNVPIKQLSFERLNLKFKLERNLMIVEDFKLEGKEGSAQITGRIQNFKKPIIDLKGTGVMGPVEKPLMSAEFQISGPLNHPVSKVKTKMGGMK